MVRKFKEGKQINKQNEFPRITHATLIANFSTVLDSSQTHTTNETKINSMILLPNQSNLRYNRGASKRNKKVMGFLNWPNECDTAIGTIKKARKSYTHGERAIDYFSPKRRSSSVETRANERWETHNLQSNWQPALLSAAAAAAWQTRCGTDRKGQVERT